MADRAAQDDLAGDLASRFGSRASVTEQSDGWAVFDLTGERLDAVLERLCNVDPVALGAGRVVRTVIEHIPAFVIAIAPGGDYCLLCGRSYAVSFAHVVETAMASAASRAGG
jgi:sarcosine oxidase subunit gamma